MSISVILTVLNEENNIGHLLEAMNNQSVIPNEIVIVDAGSTDKTVEIIQGFKDKLNINLVISKGVNIAEGRNIAIKMASYPVIAVIDGGAIPDRYWVEEITKPIIEGKAEVVGGFFKPVAKNKLQKAIAQVTTAPKPERNFLPSSRSIAFHKSVWEEVGGYPEWLNWGEDTFFNKMWKDKNKIYVVNENAIVFWEVRDSVKALSKQFYRYAYGDGVAKRVSYSYVILMLNLWITILSIPTFIILGHIIILFSGVLFFSLFIATLLLTKILKKRITEHFFLSGVVLSIIHVSRLLGYITGLIKRIRGVNI